MLCCRNTATDAVKQELLFVGQESGKLLAIRNLVKQVSKMFLVAISLWSYSVSPWCI